MPIIICIPLVICSLVSISFENELPYKKSFIAVPLLFSSMTSSSFVTIKTLEFSRSSLFSHDILNIVDEYVEQNYFKANFITSIPLWVFEIDCLTFIHLVDNKISFVPKEIACLRNLEFFDISENALTEIPSTISELKLLKVLNISKNSIKVLPREIGRLESLEILRAGQNLISYILEELGDCKKLIEISFDDNVSISRIPPRIFALHLEIVRINRCRIYHLPFIKCISLTTFNMCENYLLTHIPYYYETFITEEYAHQHSFNLSEPLAESIIQLETVKDKRLLILPEQLTTIYPNDTRQPLKLFELSLSAVHHFIGYNIVNGRLPNSITSLLRAGPVARCGGAFCNVYLFHECYLLILKRNRQRNDHVIISHLFCSKDCLENWFDDKSYFYRKIEWKYI